MLTLRFSSQYAAIELACGGGDAAKLHRLRTRFASAATVSNTAITVGVDDFLGNLGALTTWPDTDFEWQPELLTLVEDNYADTTLVADELATSVGSELAPRVGVASETADAAAPEAEQAHLPGAPWDAPMTAFQRRDLARLQRLRHNANFSVPGAGKTRVTLALFQHRRATGGLQRMMVVSPKSAFEAWQDETAECFTERTTVATMTGSTPPECDILLVNYERLPEAIPALLRWLQAQSAMLVLDEAHRMKLGAAGAWGAACYALGPYATHRVILTGTPAPNGSQDLANLFGFVWPGQGRATVNRAVSGRDLREASALLKPLFTRTTKAQLNLPPVVPIYRRVILPPLHREVYDALVGMATRQYHDGTADAEALGKVVLYLLMAATTPALIATGSSRYEPLTYRVPPLTPPPDSSLAALMRDLPSYEMSPKYAEVMAIARENAEAGRKTLIWSTFVRNLTSLEMLLAPYSPAVVHGGIDDRDAQLRRFRTDPQCMVLLSNPATLGEGVSLHHTCHEAVYLDRDFAAGRYLQSLDRIHRLGLAPGTRTRITILVADQTIDEVIQQRMDSKVRFLLGILDDPAVQQLTDLDEEPSASAGMDRSNLAALTEHLQGHAPA